MTDKELTTIGAMLYACEGTKARRDYRYDGHFIHSIELTNSDPKIVRTFSLFLKKIIQADWSRVRGQLFIYPDLNGNELVRYWSEVSSIPEGQFQKNILLKAKNGKFKANPFGTFKIRYTCKKDFLKLQSMIEKVWKTTES
ncbi:MAG: hypothetical protein MUD10_05240 [Candidatus Pacebacteria bacterium]|nr:hypothetical protein [Candidatus Paceibacterota bacterium]